MTPRLTVIAAPSLIAAFKKHHPRVQVTPRTKTSRKIEELLLNSDVEIALITSLSELPLLQASYRVEGCVAFISARHPLAKKNQLTMAELAECPLIIKKQRSNEGTYLMQMEARGFQPNVLTQRSHGMRIGGDYQSGGDERHGLGISVP